MYLLVIQRKLHKRTWGSTSLIRAPPSKQPLRKMAPNWEEEANRQVEEMLRNGVCSPSKSPWNSEVVLVKRGPVP